MYRENKTIEAIKMRTIVLNPVHMTIFSFDTGNVLIIAHWRGFDRRLSRMRSISILFMCVGGLDQSSVTKLVKA